MPTAPETDRPRGHADAGAAPRLSFVLRNRAGSEVTPAVIRRLAIALGELPVEVVVADETIKMPSTELLAVARLEGLRLRVVRARAALADSLASIEAPWVAIADVDDRHPPEMLGEMLFEAEARGVDLVLATRRSSPPRSIRSACGPLVADISDPMTPYFLARKTLIAGMRPKPGATLLALDVLLAHPSANVSELPMRGLRRESGTPKPGVRRRAAETVHVARLVRAGAGRRAHSARDKASEAAAAIASRAEHPLVLPLLLCVIAAAALLRFWALPSLHFYGHDEGRASLAAHRMLVEHRPVLTGQPTSRGVYLGPGYYYLVTPFYLLFGMSPFAGAFLAAIAGIGAAYLTYRVTRAIFGPASGLAAGAIMATAPIAVYFGRFGWNPNTLPFFAALFLFALIRAPERPRWLAVAAFCAGLAPQLHASGLILPATFALWLLTRRPKLRAASWVKLGAVFALPLLPMAAGELRSGFEGTKSWLRLLLGRGAPGVDMGGSVVAAFKDVFVQTIGTARFSLAATLVLLAVIGLVAWERVHWSDRRVAPAFQTVALFAIVGVAGALVWRGQMFAYWLLPWLPAAVALFAGGFVHLCRIVTRPVAGRRGSLVAPVLAVGLIAGFNVASVANPLRLPDQFDSGSPAAFANVAAASDWIARRTNGPVELQVWTPYAWDTAHNSTNAFDYLLLRKGIRPRPGGAQLFVVAMEDVYYPHLRQVRGEVLRRYRDAFPGRAPIAAQDFGGMTVFELARR